MSLLSRERQKGGGAPMAGRGVQQGNPQARQLEVRPVQGEQEGEPLRPCPSALVQEEACLGEAGDSRGTLQGRGGR